MTTRNNYIDDVIKCINHKRSTLHIAKARQLTIHDWVLVDRRDVQVKAGINQSCTHKRLGPHEVITAIGCHAYRLEVPKSMRWHNVVHTTRFKPFRRRDQPQEMDEDKEEIWEVEEIVNSSRDEAVVQYRVW